MAKILGLNRKSISECIAALDEGRAIAYPTDTIYGLGVDATNIKAVKRLFRIKRRDPGKPVYVAVANIAQARSVAVLNRNALRLAEALLPGPLTLIVKSRVAMQGITYRGTIGIRIPDNAFALALLRKLQKPITATSANISGGPGAADFKDMDLALLDRIDVAVDGGRTKYMRASTIVDVTGATPKVLREGVVARSVIENILKTKSE